MMRALLRRLFGATDTLTEVKQGLEAAEQKLSGTIDKLDVVQKAAAGDRSYYLTCPTCGCGGNWHYAGCEAGKKRGDMYFILKGGLADQMMREPPR